MKKRTDLIINSQKLREILIIKGLTVEGLARKANVSYGTASNVVRNIGFPYPATLKKICDALEIDPAEIIIKNDK